MENHSLKYGIPYFKLWKSIVQKIARFRAVKTGKNSLHEPESMVLSALNMWFKLWNSIDINKTT